MNLHNIKINKMKKILMLMLLFPMLVNAQIKIFPKVAVSYSDETLRVADVTTGNRYDFMFRTGLDADVTTGNRYDFKYPAFMFRTGLDAKYKKFTLYYDTKIWCASSNYQFDPQQAIFEVGVTYNVNEKIKINVHHTCLHPLSADNGTYHDGLYGGGNVITVSYGY